MRSAGSEDEVSWGKPQHRMGRPCHLEGSSRLMFTWQVACWRQTCLGARTEPRALLEANSEGFVV